MVIARPRPVRWRAASMRTSLRISGSSRSRRSALAASLFARAGSSWTSMNTRVHARRHARGRQRLDVLGQAGRDAVARARQLQAVGDVEDHRPAQRAQHREGAHVHHQVVVAEGHAALGHQHLRAAGARHLGNRVPHVVGRQELALLDVHHPAGPGRGHQQIGLARQERRNLQDVRDFGGRCRPAPGSWMSVRIGRPVAPLTSARMRRPASRPGPRYDDGRGAVRLVERRLEHDGHAAALADLADGRGQRQRVAAVFDDAGPDDEGQGAGANRMRTDLDGVGPSFF